MPTTYFSDGTGRDSYIYHKNGGLMHSLGTDPSSAASTNIVRASMDSVRPFWTATSDFSAIVRHPSGRIVVRHSRAVKVPGLMDSVPKLREMAKTQREASDRLHNRKPLHYQLAEFVNTKKAAFIRSGGLIPAEGEAISGTVSVSEQQHRAPSNHHHHAATTPSSSSASFSSSSSYGKMQTFQQKQQQQHSQIGRQPVAAAAAAAPFSATLPASSFSSSSSSSSSAGSRKLQVQVPVRPGSSLPHVQPPSPSKVHGHIRQSDWGPQLLYPAWKAAP